MEERARCRLNTLESAIQPRHEMHLGRTHLDKMYAKVEKDILKSQGNCERVQLYQSKLALLKEARKNIGQLDAAELDQVCLPPKKLTPVNGKFLTVAEHEFLSGQKQCFEQRRSFIQEFRSTATPIAQFRKDVGEMNASACMLKAGASTFDFWGTKRGAWNYAEGSNSAENIVKEWRSDKWCHKIGEGVAVGGAALAADWLGDRMLGHEQNTFTRPSYYLEFPVVSAALLYPAGSMARKLAVTTAAVLVGKTLDDTLPAAVGNCGELMRPNWIDAFGTSAAWTLPWSSSKARILGITGAWMAGRAGNIAAHLFHVPVPGIDQTTSTDEDSLNLAPPQ
jgi:hypothetical protein